MRCEDLQDHFADYLAGDLAEPLQSQVLEHLESCAPCSEEAGALRKIWASRDSHFDQPNSPAMRARYDALLTAYKQSSEFLPSGFPRRRSSLRRQALQVLVAITLLGIAVFAAQRTGLIVMIKTFGPAKPEVQTGPLALPAPVVQATTAKGSIEGTVLRAGSNEPVAGAQVSAFWAASPAAYDPVTVPRTVTDREGKFVVEVEPGDYQVSVSARGYAPQTYGNKASGIGNSGIGTLVSAAAGKPTKDVVVHLTPSGVISGRITAATGEPLLGMEVVVLRVVYEAHGFRNLTAAAYAGMTDDRGQYRVSGLAPGRYYVRAGSAAEVNGDMYRARTDYIGLPRPFSYGKYKTIYYPQESDLSTAAMVEVQGNAERTGLDFVLSRQFETHRVRGSVVDPSGEAIPPKTSVRLTPYGVYLTAYGGGVAANPDGTFDIHDVMPGTYWLTADIPRPLTPEQQQLVRTPGVDFSQLPAPLRGNTFITVGSSDIDYAVVTIARDLSVMGRISVEGEPTSRVAGMENIKIEFLPTSGLIPGRNVARGKVGPDGTFAYTNLWPEEYLIWIRDLPPDAYVKQGRLGDIDILNGTIRITGPVSDSLNLVLGLKGGLINGTLTDAQSALVAGKQIVLVPDQPAKRHDFYKTTITDRNGRFTIRGIAPGDYTLYAWENLEAFRYFDPDYVKQFETAATPVRIGENASVTADVRLIPELR